MEYTESSNNKINQQLFNYPKDYDIIIITLGINSIKVYCC